MNKILSTLVICVVALTSSTLAFAQSEADTTKVKQNLLNYDFGDAGNLKISGYIQAQAQVAESPGIPAFAQAGAFDEFSNSRFTIRRARIKFAYHVGFATLVIQPNFSEKKVGVKDLYIKLQSKNKIIGGNIGVFDRPFGYSVSYSSTSSETPERCRIFQSLFPGESDLGAMVSSSYKGFNLEAGIFNGNGIAEETDSRKDFIGRFHYAAELDNINLGAVVSYYNGVATNPTTRHYEYQEDGGFKGFVNDEGQEYSREYTGVGMYVRPKWSFGPMNIMAEYIWGTQPGTSVMNYNPAGGFAPVGNPLYVRDFAGGYVLVSQRIAEKHTVVFEYDYYDPNTRIAGDKIGDLDNTGIGDIAYSTFGLGYNFQWTKNLKLTAYYEFVSNEQSQNVYAFDKEVADNVFTFRVQFKF